MKKETRGRKPLPEDKKKIEVRIYLPGYVIKRNGGLQKVKSKIKNYIK